MIVLGVEILAVWFSIASVSGIVGDSSSVFYNMMLGMFMFCLYVIVIVVYVKMFNFIWLFVVMKLVFMMMGNVNWFFIVMFICYLNCILFNYF